MKKILVLALIAIPALSACLNTTGQKTGQTAGQSLVHNASFTEEMPEIDGILVRKSTGQMTLVSDGRAVKTYDVDFGFSPTGTKNFEGDGRTPEGTYYIDRKNPKSQFYLSLGISYPNKRDVAKARAMGKDPGGDIFIHGQGRWGRGRSGTNWTRGCIATTDEEAREIYEMVDIGTPITILP